MNKIRALIVDDEGLARERLRGLVEAEPDITVVAECADGRSALEAIRKHRPELVFMDANLPEINGVDVLDLLEEQPRAVIFVTAFARFAVRAFASNAADYLLKPFNGERFRKAVETARRRIRGMSGAAGNGLGRENIVALETPSRIVLLNTGDIDAVVAGRGYAVVYASGETLRTTRKLGELAAQLNSQDFIRINRSTVVNRQRVRAIEKKAHGDGVAHLNNGRSFPMSRRYRTQWANLLP